MRALGATIELDHGYVVANAKGGRLTGGDFRFEKSSVGATVNVMLAAVLAEGTTHLDNVAIEPDVIELGLALKKMGARIEGLGTHSMEIEGVEALHPTDITNCPDRIELGTFMIAAAMAGVPGEPVNVRIEIRPSRASRRGLYAGPCGILEPRLNSSTTTCLWKRQSSCEPPLL